MIPTAVLPAAHGRTLESDDGVAAATALSPISQKGGKRAYGSPRKGPESAPSPKAPSTPFQTTATPPATGHPRRDIFGDPF